MALHKQQYTVPHTSAGGALFGALATSRPDGVNLAAILKSKEALQLVQRAIQVATLPSRKPTLAEVSTAIDSIVT